MHVVGDDNISEYTGCIMYNYYIFLQDGTKYGPRDTVNLHCECGGNSEGSTCENCETGYFRSGKKCVE